jgi:hypothetical protein
VVEVVEAEVVEAEVVEAEVVEAEVVEVVEEWEVKQEIRVWVKFQLRGVLKQRSPKI